MSKMKPKKEPDAGATDEYHNGFLSGIKVCNDMIAMFVLEDTTKETFVEQHIIDKILEDALWVEFYAINNETIHEQFELGFTSGVRSELRTNDLTKKFYVSKGN